MRAQMAKCFPWHCTVWTTCSKVHLVCSSLPYQECAIGLFFESEVLGVLITLKSDPDIDTISKGALFVTLAVAQWNSISGFNPNY